MDKDAQLRLQAFLDGELPEGEARAVAQWVAQDPEAAALAAELRNTRGALTGFEADMQLPESREYFWSKVQREIQRLETPPTKPDPAPVFALFRRFWVPSAAFALVVMVGGVLSLSNGPFRRAATGGIETALADSGAFTYRDYAAGTTLVWLSYPAENEIADEEDIGTMVE